MNIEYSIQRTEYNKMILSKLEIQKQGQNVQRSKVIEDKKEIIKKKYIQSDENLQYTTIPIFNMRRRHLI